MNNRQSQQQPNQQQSQNNIIQQFAEFRKQLGNQNPQMIVNNLLSNGKMTQSQFEQLKQQASLLQNILK